MHPINADKKTNTDDYINYSVFVYCVTCCYTAYSYPKSEWLGMAVHSNQTPCIMLETIQNTSKAIYKQFYSFKIHYLVLSCRAMPQRNLGLFWLFFDYFWQFLYSKWCWLILFIFLIITLRGKSFEHSQKHILNTVTSDNQWSMTQYY